ncbi:GerAB/ArcD/ProY family transporter [Paenibacillus sp. 2TAB19]|uniref:GerAB/ArcD/ProY family transporter n=1 Tax=Paenibacillus sp. 2TAB19 TaxID=3233003 RepID=UPI003F94BAFD
MPKTFISAFQLCVLMFLSLMGTAFLTEVSSAAPTAGHDLWVAPIWGLAGGLLCIFAWISLHNRYPGMSLVQYADRIVGPVVGKLLSLLFLFYVTYATAYMLRQFCDFINISFLMRTPPIVLAFCLILLSAIIIWCGVEVLCRLAVFFLPFPFLLCALIFWPLYSDLKPVLPLFENGLLPSLQGAFVLQTWYAMFSLITFYLPSVGRNQKIKGWSVTSTVMLCLMLVIINWHVASFLRHATEIYLYPVMVISRYSSFSEFFEHLESIAMMVWVVLVIIRVSYGYYCLATGMGQWFKLPDLKPVIIPMGMLLLIFSFWGMQSSLQVTLNRWIVPVFYITCAIVLPLLLLLIDLCRRGLHPNKKATESSHSKDEAEGASL